MNLFRLAGDMIHLFSIFALLFRITTNKSVKGALKLPLLPVHRTTVECRSNVVCYYQDIAMARR